MEDWERYKAAMEAADDAASTGNTETPSAATLTVAVVANAYAFGLVCRVLRATHTPYTCESGRRIKRRGAKCGTSTTSQLLEVEAMSGFPERGTTASRSTETESAQQPEEATGG